MARTPTPLTARSRASAPTSAHGRDRMAPRAALLLLGSALLTSPLVGCGGGDPSPSPTPVAQRLQPSPSPRVRVEPVASPLARRGPPRRSSPSRDVWGLRLGTVDQQGVQSWLEGKGASDCTPERGEGADQPARMGWTCSGLQLGSERPGEAEVQLILEGGPLARASARWTHPREGAIAAYQAAGERLSEMLGNPTAAARVPGDEALDGRLVRFVTSWRFQQMQVQVRLERQEGAFSVVEDWRWEGSGQPAARPASGEGRRTVNINGREVEVQVLSGSNIRFNSRTGQVEPIEAGDPPHSDGAD